MKYDISSVLEAASEAATEAVNVLTIYDSDIDSGSIEEALEEVIDEAVEAALKEHKPEPVFTVAELSTLRSGIHHERMEAVSAEHAKRCAAIRFNIDMETEEWKRFECEDTKRLDALYEKLSDMISQSIAERHK